mgnify:CR=1 FL=1
MSGEYINRETLRDLMYTEAFDRDTGLQRWDSGLWIRFKLFENCLDAIPAADVKPVVKAHWIWMGDTGDSRFMCSNCKGKENVPTVMGKPTVWEYCPNCGAKMDGGQKYV